MRYTFNFIDGESIDLTTLREKENIFSLIDESNQSFLTFSINNSDFSWEIQYKNEKIITDDTFNTNMRLVIKQLVLSEQSGIEESMEDEHDKDPFNPEEISIDTKPITMETLMRRLQQGTIILNPDFQRNEVWDSERKSQLIESLLLKIPIPMFYVSSDEKSNWTVVDGLQRISTLRDFVLGKYYLENPQANANKKGYGFKLQGLEFWSDLENSTLNDLPTNLQNRILETTFTFTIINPGTPEEVKRNVFKRLNTGGMPLSSQEIRNALYTGKSTELLNTLAGLKDFKLATGGSIHTDRMEDRELILRFISFLIRDYKFYNKTVTVDTWLSDTMIILNSLPELDSRELNKRIDSGKINNESIRIIKEDEVIDVFKKAMDRCYKIFENHAFRKSYVGLKRSPVNKSLFETWSNLLACLSDEEFSILLSNKNEFLKAYKPLLDDSEFIISISRDSMKHTSVRLRFEKLNNLLRQFIS
mgnify:CR=1 FL=1